jgi:hypothetical protein
VSVYVVTFPPTVAIRLNELPCLVRSTLKPVSLFELSLQDRLIWLDDTAVAIRFVGAAGVGLAVNVGVGVGVGLGVGVDTGVDVGVGVGLGVDAGVGVEVGVGGGVVVGVALGTGVGVGVWQRLVVSACAVFE